MELVGEIKLNWRGAGLLLSGLKVNNPSSLKYGWKSSPSPAFKKGGVSYAIVRMHFLWPGLMEQGQSNNKWLILVLYTPFVSLEQLGSINRSVRGADGYTFKQMQQAECHDSAHE